MLLLEQTSFAKESTPRRAKKDCWVAGGLSREASYCKYRLVEASNCHSIHKTAPKLPAELFVQSRWLAAAPSHQICGTK